MSCSPMVNFGTRSIATKTDEGTVNEIIADLGFDKKPDRDISALDTHVCKLKASMSDLSDEKAQADEAIDGMFSFHVSSRIWS